MAFWSGATLAARLPGLIEGFDPDQIDCAAYTLRVGPEAYVSPSTAAAAATRTKTMLDDRADFPIPPGQFAFVLTEECVTVPKSAIAFISMKAKIKFKGLVNVSGFHVDPGYCGRLVFGVYNAGPATVHLARGDDCFLIWYACLDVETEKYARKSASFYTIPSDLVTPVAGPLQSLAGLSDRIGRVERQHQGLQVGAAVASALFIALLVLVIPLLVQSCQVTSQREESRTISAPVADPSATRPADSVVNEEGAVEVREPSQ